jgi:carbon monoxide dehydrogenase subunit G
MRIEQNFNVPAAPPDTYELLVDLERVAPCIPGGEVGPRGDDGSHPASIAVRLGPMRMNYRGRVRIEDRDDAARRAVLAADLREQRGQGTAKATMTMAVAASDSGARVESVTDVRLTGRAGQMGRGVVDDVAARLVAEMAACIAARFAPPEGGASAGGEEIGPPERAKPISGLQLMARVLWARLKRAFRDRGGETHA